MADLTAGDLYDALTAHRQEQRDDLNRMFAAFEDRQCERYDTVRDTLAEFRTRLDLLATDHRTIVSVVGELKTSAGRQDTRIKNLEREVFPSRPKPTPETNEDGAITLKLPKKDKAAVWAAIGLLLLDLLKWTLGALGLLPKG